jgi:glycosyltransferase involved in cell wall biosynthesis
MNLTIAVLSYNRREMLIRTLTSIYKSSAEVVIYDNGSRDNSDEIVRSLGGVVNTGKNQSTGHGMNEVIGLALKTNPDIVLFSADDFLYDNNFEESILEFWQNCPADVKLASCYLEPDWEWNKTTETGDAGKVHYAIRESIPGSNWMFRASDKDLILPIAEKTGGEDIEICRRLREQGYKLAALDLVDHIGERKSAWGNQSWRYAKELDRKGLGFNDR